MRRLLSLCALVIGSGFAGSCNPLEPGACRNGRDSSGRGPFVTLEIRSCDAVRSDVQCRADRVETSYCAGPTRDVTDAVEWVSSDPAIAVFDASVVPRGYLKVLADGRVEVTARIGFLTSRSQTFNVSPASVPRQDIQLRVSLVDDRTNQRIAGGRVDIRPLQGTPQTCHTDSNGSCRFELGMIVGGTTDVTVSAQGYVNLLRTVPYCLNCEFVLRLIPAAGTSFL